MKDREIHKEYRKELKEWIDQIKLESGCVDCGYREHAVALDFDHVDPTMKVASVSELVRTKGRKGLTEEIAKCVVRCANCHRVKTWGNKDAR